MDGDLVRQTFLEFFESKGHRRMPSSSLVPVGDPTMLFTSAGMVPFKPYFTGEATPPSPRLTSCQKSFRTTDVDEVGDHKHLTFFEMLGNFSIGDYFKAEAIEWSWEFVTECLKLPPERLYITIYQDDEEAFRHWVDEVKVPTERIYRYGDKDNWWGPAGKEGPNGPCSEIHYDGGEEHGCGQPDCHPNHDCERFVELWNLVFMQYYQDTEGNRTPLPSPSIDTGMGLERAAAILQGKRTIYETDLFWPIVQRVEEVSGKAYGEDRDTDYAIRVVAEHARAAAFLIADGVVPGNEGRGYVLRRIIRRAMFYYSRYLEPGGVILPDVADAVVDRMKQTYPELLDNWDHIRRVLEEEEDRFRTTLNAGTRIIQREIVQMSTSLEKHFLDPNWRKAIQVPVDELAYSSSALPTHIREAFLHPINTVISSFPPPSQVSTEQQRYLLELAKRIPGKAAFLLHDTHGFPVELTAEIAKEHGLSVDMEGFQREMEAQRERARAAHAFTGAMEMLPTYENLGVGGVEFVGYDTLGKQAEVVALMNAPASGPEGALVDTSPIGHATQGQRVELVLDTTPFYPEGGGQVGDAGIIAGPNGRVRIEDTQSPVAGLVVHRGVVVEGDISLGEAVEARVDLMKRQDTSRNHSGTHLLHAALRQMLGPHVRQAGSLVASDRLRFDYSHVSPLARGELLDIQGLVNQKVRDNLAVNTRQSGFTQAVQEGALAFFGDKYGDMVRVVEMSDGERFSLEVCGGTHVKATGQVGPLFVVGESSIGGGMRRIEAVTGRAAEQLYVERSALLESLSRKLQTPLVDLETRLENFIQDADRLKKQVVVLEREILRRESQELLHQVRDVEGMKVLAAKTSASSVDAMREMGDRLKAQLSSGVIVLAAVHNNRPILVAMVTPDLVDRGLHAGNIAREAARVMEGDGGGRPEMAQAGGKRADRLEEALERVPELVRKEAGL